MAELARFSEYSLGTSPIIGSGAETALFSELSNGQAAISGTGVEAARFSEVSAGMVGAGGTARETARFSEFARGAATVLGSGREAAFFSERSTGVVSIGGIGREEAAFSEKAFQPITGTSRNQAAFSEQCYGLIVVADDGVWVVNLATGGHARYTGDLTGATPVEGYAVCPVSKLGSSNAKYVPDVLVHARCAGDLELSLTTDEQTTRTYHLGGDGREGLHEHRIRAARGLKGTNWQARIGGVDGSAFTIKEITLLPVESSRIR